jgi:hypothetical protein
MVVALLKLELLSSDVNPSPDEYYNGELVRLIELRLYSGLHLSLETNVPHNTSDKT